MPGATNFGLGVEGRLEKHLTKTPDVGRAAFIAPGAAIMGDVVLERDSSVFYGAILRGDIAEIRVGEGSNVQDGAIVHLGDDAPAIIGSYCTVGHGAIVHGCRIGNEVLIGMGAIILDFAEVGDRSVIGANSLVPKGMKIPPGSMVYGSPAKVVRALSEEEQAGLRTWAEKYVVVAKAHAAKMASRKA